MIGPSRRGMYWSNILFWKPKQKSKNDPAAKELWQLVYLPLLTIPSTLATEQSARGVPSRYWGTFKFPQLAVVPPNLSRHTWFLIFLSPYACSKSLPTSVDKRDSVGSLLERVKIPWHQGAAPPIHVFKNPIWEGSYWMTCVYWGFAGLTASVGT